MNGRVPPHNIQVEESLLGAMLLSRHAVDDVIEAGVAIADFYKPSHQYIFEAMSAIRATSTAIDAVTVADELRRSGHLDEIGGIEALLELQLATPAISNAKRYAKIIIETAILRRMIGAAGEIASLAYDEPDDVGEAIDRALELLRQIDLPVGVATPSLNVDDFMAAVPSTYDWVVPGMLERGDRLIITGFEGHGKSTIMRQIAICIASGIHPWTLNLVEPRRVFLLDAENNPRMVSRKMAALRAKVRSTLDPDFLRIEAMPDGLNLTQRADRRWLTDQVLANQTDVLIIGPHYNLDSGVGDTQDSGGQDYARKLARVLRDITVKAKCCVLLEAHSPHGPGENRPLRPFGSSVWMRWPEFGVGLRQMGDDGLYRLEHWRPPRDERIWPDWLRKGGEWPWTPTFDGARPSHPT